MHMRMLHASEVGEEVWSAAAEENIFRHYGDYLLQVQSAYHVTNVLIKVKVEEWCWVRYWVNVCDHSRESFATVL